MKWLHAESVCADNARDRRWSSQGAVVPTRCCCRRARCDAIRRSLHRIRNAMLTVRAATPAGSAMDTPGDSIAGRKDTFRAGVATNLATSAIVDCLSETLERDAVG
jgi:hypothetical protein